MDPTKIPKGQSSEETPAGSRNPLGVYFHPSSGKRLVALSVPAADAFALQGFEFEGKYDPAKPPKTDGKARVTRTVEDNTADLEKQLAEANAARKAAEKAQADAEAKAAELAKKTNNGGNN